MQDFAKASRLLVQPLSGTSDQFLDPTYPKPKEEQKPQDFDIRTSPYGDIDRWDLLWLGHCGARFSRATDRNVPLGRAVIYDDETVPEPQHIKMQFGDTELVEDYPPYTRVVSSAWENVCTLGYGLSLLGARRLLYELSVHKMTAPTDISFRSVCGGLDERPVRSCLTVQPQIFQHHRPIGSKASFSDISTHDTEHNERAFTRNVRWSTRLNFPKLIDGLTDYIDLLKDGEEADSSLDFK